MTAKTEREKLLICKNFLEKRGWVVTRGLMTAEQLATILQVAPQTISNWRSPSNPNFVPDFPQWVTLSTATKRRTRRWRVDDVTAWLDKRTGRTDDAPGDEEIAA